jgi:acyl transferase domain-containing protein
VSHYLNLKGPCLTIDTACSSSFAALYLAVNALRNQQCSMAITGGVHLNLCPENFIGLTRAHMISATDKCSSFDIHADGYARSDGCGVLIIKRLSDAIRDKDTIHAVIKTVVMNQDGNDGTILVAPNIKSQIAMHQASLAEAHLEPGDIDYIEAHGTGTVLGDSVEFNAIAAVHEGHHSLEKPLIIGAVKSNLGHSIAASGVASVIKAVYALKNEVIPPNLHYSAPNKTINPERVPVLFPVKPVDFVKQVNKKRYVQISNFGFTGTNVGSIIEEAPDVEWVEPTRDNDQPQCFVISAKSEYSLKEMLTHYVSYLQQTTASLRDICYT